MFEEVPHVTKKSLADKLKIPIRILIRHLSKERLSKVVNKECGIYSRGGIKSKKFDLLEKAPV